MWYGYLYEACFPCISNITPLYNMSHLDDLLSSGCAGHECDFKNEHLFPFWMHKLPLSLRGSLLSHSLSDVPQISHVNKARAIRSLSSSFISGTVARLLEQVADGKNSAMLRREAFLSLKIVTDVHTQAILEGGLLSSVFQGALTMQDNHDATEDSGTLSILNLCTASPVMEALEFIHHASRVFPPTAILGELRKVLSDHIRSSQPIRRFYGLMAFVVSTGPCAEDILPLSIEVLNEIARYPHMQCPLVDFALTMLILSWRCRRQLFARCIELRTSLIYMFISSIQRHSSTNRVSDLVWAAVSCLGIQAILENSPNPIFYIPDCVRCFISLSKKLLHDDHGQLLQGAEIPVESLGYAAKSVGPLFAPYLKSTLEILKEIHTYIPLGSYESIHWTAGGVMGDFIAALGRKNLMPHIPFLVQNILKLGESTHPRLRFSAYRVLARLTFEFSGTMSPYLHQLVPMLLNSIWRAEPSVQTLSEYCLSVSEKCHAISAINYLATLGSILVKFVGAACRINMSLLAHEDPMIRAEACDCLLYQILWNSEVNAHLPNEFLRYVAYYIRRLDKGEYIVSEARLEPVRSMRIKKVLALMQDLPQPLVKLHPISHAPVGIFSITG